MNTYSKKNKREIIMKNYLEAKKKSLEKINKDGKGKIIVKSSNNCSDFCEIKFFIDKNKTIKKYEYSAHGCAVFMASLNIFCKKIVNKKIKFAKNLSKEYENFLNGKNNNSETLGELNVFENIKIHFNRLNCALLINKVVEDL